mmetsp:Transcript_27706/g.38177  ORF Transcript_27706/g.38177 Transcript_27706/m.38177 type:complete len:290 (+) Transcript_27706:387-1256(+)
MLNDFQVDPSGMFIYIADTSILAYNPAIIVYDIEKDASYRVLSGHHSLYGQSVFLQINSTIAPNPTSSSVCPAGVCVANVSGSLYELRLGPIGVKLHVDSIALDRSGSTLYFGALTGGKLYSISTSYLLNYIKKVDDSPDLQDKLRRGVEEQVRLVLKNKPVTDGISVDSMGNIWMTAVEHSSLCVAVPNQLLEGSSAATRDEVSDSQSFRVVNVVQSRRYLRWPDGLSFGPDGLYITASALHYNLLVKEKNVSSKGPFHILRLPLKYLKKVQPELQPKKKFVSTPAGH